MKQLRYLTDIQLDQETKTIQPNGAPLSAFASVGVYKAQVQPISDQISVAIYGADISKMVRISSPLGDLEAFLNEKMNNSSDNVSLYSVLYDGARYRITAVNRKWVDLIRT